jgi:hypothetical protein
MTTGRTWDALWRGCALLKPFMHNKMGRMGRTLGGNLLLATRSHRKVLLQTAPFAPSFPLAQRLSSVRGP